MRKPLSLTVLICCLAMLASSLAFAGPRGRDLPQRYVPASLDGRLVEVLNPLDGTLWAAWAYRNGAEYDLAVSCRDERGFWSEPTFIGEFDGLDQTQPALAADNWGNVYLAYTEQRPDRIMLTWLEAGTSVWSTPSPVTEPEVAAMYPALRAVGDRLVVAFRSGRGLVILDLPLLEPALNGNIFNDGPDPVESRNSGDQNDPPNEEESEAVVPLDQIDTNTWSSSSAN